MSLATRERAAADPLRAAGNPVVRVTWLDAWCDTDSEVSLAEVGDELQECVDFGILIKRTRKAVVIASNYQDEDELVRFVTRIPASLVIKIERVTGYETIFDRRAKRAGAKDVKS